MFRSRPMIREMLQTWAPAAVPSSGRVVWFTDTLKDLNGVSETIQTAGREAFNQKRDIWIATTLDPAAKSEELPPQMLALPTLFDMNLPYYEKIRLRFPSILKTIEMVHKLEPDAIFISTPGPVGLMGLLVAWLLNLPCTGIYHTDFASQAKALGGQDDLVAAVESYIKWVYSRCEKIMVPTYAYLELLQDRGYPKQALCYYRKGVNLQRFRPNPLTPLSPHPILLYVGRVSKDKNLDFLLEVYRHLLLEYPELELKIVGEGPDLPTLRAASSDLPGVSFLGRVNNQDLPDIYSASDVFVFPSTTDTFGMAVLEAQACGCPAVESNQGGQQEIIKNSLTGLVVPAGRPEAWAMAIGSFLDMKKHSPEAFLEVRYAAAQHARENFSFTSMLDDLFEPQPVSNPLLHPASR